jgi:hypothetical protein
MIKAEKVVSLLKAAISYLPSPGLHHEFTGKMLYRCWFQRAKDNTLV